MPSPGEYVLVRSRDQGVMCGEYVTHTGREVTLRFARQVWSWTENRLTLVDVSVVPGSVRLSRPSHGEVVMLEACGIITPTPEVAAFLRGHPAS